LPFLTPDAEGGFITRPLRIPMELLPIVGGLFAELLDSWNWESFGDLSVDDCVILAQGMIDDYYALRWGMVGEIKQLATATIPDNCLLCDGAEYLRADYPELYAVLDSAFIVDADHFVVPDAVNRAIVGAGDTYDTGDTFGEDTHTLSVGEMPVHDHTYDRGFGPDVATSVVLGALTGLDAIPTTATTSQAGSGDPHNNVQPSIAFPIVIVAR